jgi:tetratricopeptide (TPR) repeat protein
MRPALSILFTLLVLPAVAVAQSSEESAKAKAFYEKGMARFQLEEYEAAIALWQDGFRNKPLPEFLYNIAQAYRLSKQPERALFFYKRYLSMSPNAPNRAEVERHITSLERFLREQSSITNAAPTAPREPRPNEQPPSTQPSTPPAAVTVSTPPPKKPIYKKGWFWGVIGGVAAAAIIVGVGVGVGATKDPTASFGAVKGN